MRSTPNDEELRGKISKLRTENRRLFKCGVIPGFWTEFLKGELPFVPTILGYFTIPLSALSVREYTLYNELSRAGRITSLLDFALTDELGSPKDPRLIWDPRNWGVFTASGAAGSFVARTSLSRDVHDNRNSGYEVPGSKILMTELSRLTDLNPFISLKVGVDFSVQVLGRDETMDPVVALTMP